MPGVRRPCRKQRPLRGKQVELERVVASPSSARPSPALWLPGPPAAEQNSPERWVGRPRGRGEPSPHGSAQDSHSSRRSCRLLPRRLRAEAGAEENSSALLSVLHLRKHKIRSILTSGEVEVSKRPSRFDVCVFQEWFPGTRWNPREWQERAVR